MDSHGSNFRVGRAPLTPLRFLLLVLSVVLQIALWGMAIALPEYREMLIAVASVGFVVSIPVWVRIQELVGDYLDQ